MDTDLLDRLRDDLSAAEYRTDTIGALLGSAADAARERGVFAAARRVLAQRPSSSLSALTRLFLLGEAVARTELERALPSLRARGALELGLVEIRSHGVEEGVDGVDGEADEDIEAGEDGEATFRAAVSLNPVRIEDDARFGPPQHWWIISDLDDQLRGGPARPDHVMGVGGATRSLIGQLPPERVSHALDLGTGCGVVALHLALRGPTIATDISERALRFARMNAALNGLDRAIEFRRGDLFEPVAGERFALIASNPPFVITPRGAGPADANAASAVGTTGDGAPADEPPVFTYRDGGRVGDALARAVVRAAPAHLAPGGSFVGLANWEAPWGVSGLARVGEWVSEAAEEHGPLEAWVIERDLIDPADYAEVWARDGGSRPGSDEFEAFVRRSLDDFAARRIVAIGLGSVRMRRVPPGEGETGAGADAPERARVRAEHATGPYASGERLGASFSRTFAEATAAARMSDAEILAAHWLRAPDATEVRAHTPGEEQPRSIELVSEAPILRRVDADTLRAAAFGACDGDLSLERIAGALATLLDVDAAAVATALVEDVRELTWLGLLSRRAQ